jgi:hypothetical protein
VFESRPARHDESASRLAPGYRRDLGVVEQRIQQDFRCRLRISAMVARSWPHISSGLRLRPGRTAKSTSPSSSRRSLWMVNQPVVEDLDEP